ncbi:TonB-dependent receptor [Ravibacter arvi]|uniref:TonB-dependent receptor n=1 Tax=Ravibacter arvi TaxID=2051041 RepID=A0ABP8LXI3_9BACT
MNERTDGTRVLKKMIRSGVTHTLLGLLVTGVSFANDRHSIRSVAALPLAASSVQEIKGVVKDEKGETLPGVSILLKGTQSGTVTDVNGVYNFTVPDSHASPVLVFSFVGYLPKEVPLSRSQSTLNVTLEADVKALDELVVIGYGTAKKSDLTGSVARVSADAFKSQPMTQVSDMLTGTVAGFYANQGTKAAGGSSMELRGPNSLTAGTSPMIVLDGVVYNGSISDINPNDIENIDILKDASSAAVFGARAASGVILITTKRGKGGKPTISLTTNFGAASITRNDFGARSPQEYLDFRTDYFRTVPTDFPAYHYLSPNALPEGVTIEQWRNTVPASNANDELEWLNRLNFYPGEVDAYLSGKTTDWNKEVFRTGIRSETDLSISGSSDRSRYFWSVGYVNNEGIIRGDQFSALRSRLNFDFDVAKWLNVGTNVQYSFRDESAVEANLGQMQIVTPFGSVRDSKGKLNWFPGDSENAQNPLINTLGQDRDRKINSLFASIFAEIKLPFGFTHKISFQPRITDRRDYNYWSPETIQGGRTFKNGYATREDYQQVEWMVDNLLKWNKQFGKHAFDATFLYTVEKNQIWSSKMTNNTFSPNSALGYSGIQFGINPVLLAGDTLVTGDGLMARLNYTFDNRYLFTVSARRDGYSAFGNAHPRANFPAAAFAWRISEEDFFQSNVINQLKLRLSWGRNGNRDIGPYSALAQLSSNQYFDGTNVLIGVTNATLANPELMWEETESINLGADVSLFKNRLDLTLDYYDMTTNRLLVNRTLPSLTGFTSVTTNIGRLGNKGLELTLNSVNVERENLVWKSSFNFSLNRNKIKELFGKTGTYVLEGKTYEGEIPDFANKWFIGRPIDAIWDYKILGMWQEEEKEEALKYNLRPGNIKALDINGDHRYEALQDKTFIGFSQPRFRMGLRNEVSFLKNFTAALFIRADLGHKGAFGQALEDWSTYGRRGIPRGLGYWTPENRSNEWPVLSKNTSPFGGGVMLYKPLSFVRIQDFSLSYNVPMTVANRLKLQNIRVFGAVRNLYSFDKWPGYDPESASSRGNPNLPMPRTFTAGLNISL